MHGKLPAGFGAKLGRGMAQAKDAYRDRRSDTPLARVIAEAAGRGCMTEAQIATCLARAWRMQQSECLLPGAAQALRALHAAGYRLVLASNTRRSESARRQALDRLEVESFFSGIVVSSAIGCAKPEPAFFKAVREATRGAPTLFVGDSFRRDVLGAARAGLAAIWVAPTPQPRLRHSFGITDAVGRLPALLGVES